MKLSITKSILFVALPAVFLTECALSDAVPSTGDLLL